MDISVGDYFAVLNDTAHVKRADRLLTVYDGGVKKCYVASGAAIYPISSILRVAAIDAACYFEEVLPKLSISSLLRIRRRAWPSGQYVAKVQQHACWNSETKTMEMQTDAFTYVLVEDGHIVSIEWRPTSTDMVAGDWTIVQRPTGNLI